MRYLRIFNLTTLFLLYSITSVYAQGKLPLHLMKLPPGFKIEVFAGNLQSARSLALGEKGTVFVGTRSNDKVYALVDKNNDYKVDETITTIRGLSSPNGVTFKDGSLYVAQIHRVLRYDNIENSLSNPPNPIIINDTLPKDKWHGWKYIKFGPDDKLYIPVGAPCNVCEKKDQRYSTMMRMDKDGSNLEIYSKGVRNSVGFAWHPKTDELWFTDNGRDWMGDDIPPDELNHAPKENMHFGFPYCHGKNISDPDFGNKRECSEFTPAAQELGPHVAALGMVFYDGTMFPNEYRNQIFIAEHGSWNRSKLIGYRITLVKLEGNTPVSYEPFAYGWLQGQERWGRPVDLLVLKDGSLLVSDDFGGMVYRIYYDGE